MTSQFQFKTRPLPSKFKFGNIYSAIIKYFCLKWQIRIILLSYFRWELSIQLYKRWRQSPFYSKKWCYRFWNCPEQRPRRLLWLDGLWGLSCSMASWIENWVCIYTHINEWGWNGQWKRSSSTKNCKRLLFNIN